MAGPSYYALLLYTSGQKCEIMGERDTSKEPLEQSTSLGKKKKASSLARYKVTSFQRQPTYQGMESIFLQDLPLQYTQSAPYRGTWSEYSSSLLSCL